MSLLEDVDLAELGNNHAHFPRTFLETGSFVDVFDNNRCSSTFDGLQLKQEYHQLAKASLENFIDKWYPGHNFYRADKGQIKKITRKWLDHGGGLRFWGSGQECVYVDEEDEVKNEAIEWHKDDGNKKIEQDVRALVRHEARRIAELMLVSATASSLQDTKWGPI